VRDTLLKLVCWLTILSAAPPLFALNPNSGWGSEWKSPASRSDAANLVNAVGNLVKEKSYDKALDLLDRTLQQNPGHPAVEGMRAYVLTKKGQHRQAIALYTTTLQRKNLPLDLRAGLLTGRGFAYYRIQEYRNSLNDQRQALAIAPTSSTHNNLAWTLATCPDTAIRNGKKAVAEATAAVNSAQETLQKAAYLDTLAAAYAELGDFPNALLSQKKSLALAKNASLRQGGLQRQKLYENHQPFRQSPDALD
jgi:tetratricopeptide (TPR) repeat protein